MLSCCLIASGAASASTGAQPASQAGYSPALAKDDTLRAKNAEPRDRIRISSLALGAVVPGYLSARGLPPVRGQFTVSDTGLVFNAVDGSSTIFPLVGPLRSDGGRPWRPSAVSLAYVEQARGRSVYLFRVDAGVFETEDPGPLLEVAAHPVWLDSVATARWPDDRPLVNSTDSTGLWETARAISTSRYADSLYALFGQPRAPVGLVGRRGRIAGRLGEYISSRDSLALDPGRMTGERQLRHTLAHELAHRWQTRARTQVRILWADVPPIKDPRRYGYGNPAEQQAEAIAFAINFLQSTASAAEASAAALSLLDHYELLVPGTRIMVRYLSAQRLYRNHPLHAVLAGSHPL